MADLRISELAALAGANLAAGDFLPIADVSASETKKITVTDLVGNATTLIADATIPGAKILFSSGTIPGSAIATSGITATQLGAGSVTAVKLANESTVDLVTTLPASGAFVGQLALDTDDLKIYCWDGSQWQSIKAAGSVNSVVGGTAGLVNIAVSTAGDTVTISTTLDNTSASAQFLAGPTGASGAVSYRQIVGTDLPAATTTTKGSAIVNGEGLRMNVNTIEIDNDIASTATYSVVTYSDKGLIAAGRAITASDLPAATAGAIGAVRPGTGLTVTAGGILNHTNSVTGNTHTKITYDSNGHVTTGAALDAADIPSLSAALLTSGTLDSARLAADSITGEKIANYAVSKFGETQPAADHIGQFFFNPLTRDLYLWDGNVYQPVGISVGEIIFSGTYDAGTNLIASLTSDGTAAGFTVGQALNNASAVNNKYYFVVSKPGTGTAPAPTVALNPPDILLSNGSTWTLVDVSDTVVAQIASNIQFTPYGGIGGTNVQLAIQELEDEKLSKAGGVLSGNLELGTGITLVFEGASNNAFETTLTVVDPTADQTISLPNVSGTVVTSGDTGTVTSTMILDGTIVNGDINASAEIGVSKLANGTARQLLQTDAAGTGVEWATNVDVPGTLDVTGATTLDSTLSVPLGSASAPTVFFTGDSNTGVYSPGADQVAISTGGTGRLFIDSSGRLLAGTSTARNNFFGTTLSAVTQTEGTGGGTGRGSLSVINNDVSNNPPYLLLGRSGAASLGSNAVVVSGSRLGTLTFQGADGTSFIEAATVAGEVDGTPGSTDMPGRLVFSTTADGAASPTERMRLDSTGRLGLGTASPSGKLTVAGNAIGVPVALTDAATVAVDLSLSNNYTLTLAGSRTLGAPTNQTAGQSGVVVITQDATGSRTLAFNAVWKFPGGTAPTLTTTANAVDVLAYYVESATRITARLVSDVK